MGAEGDGLDGPTALAPDVDVDAVERQQVHGVPV